MKNFLIRGDLNAHHFAWDGNHNCSNGNIIYNFTDNKVIFLNKDNFTHVSGPTYSSLCIDLLLHLHCEWSIETDNRRSDHPASIYVDVAVDSIPRNCHRYNTKLIDWEKFHKV